MYKYGRIDIRSLQQILEDESVATTEIYTHIDEHPLQSAVNSNPLAMVQLILLQLFLDKGKLN
jgi:hypothetical protein